MYCPSCGSRNRTQELVCVQCGRKLAPRPDIQKGTYTLTGKIMKIAGYFYTPAWYTHAFVLEVEDDLRVPCAQSECAGNPQESCIKTGDIVTVEGKVRRCDDPFESYKKRFIMVDVGRIQGLNTNQKWQQRESLDHFPMVPVCLTAWLEKKHFTALQLLNWELFELRNYLIRVPQRGARFLVPILAGMREIDQLIDQVAEEMASTEGLSFRSPDDLVYSSVADYVTDVTGWPRWSVERALGEKWPFPAFLAPRRYKTVLDLLIAAGLEWLVFKYLPQSFVEFVSTSFMGGAGAHLQVRHVASHLVDITGGFSERLLFGCIQNQLGSIRQPVSEAALYVA